MESEFSFEQEASFDAMYRIFDCWSGLPYTATGRNRFESAWREAKSKFLELLGPTGRITLTGTTEVTRHDGSIVLETTRTWLNKKYEELPGTRDIDAIRAKDLIETLIYGGGPYLAITPMEVAENRLLEPRDDFREGRRGKSIQKGTKLGGFVRMAAEYHGYNEAVADLAIQALSIATSALKNRNYTVVLSVNPLDMLLVSEHTTGWRSCHAAGNGEWATGPLSYMLDDVTAVAYAYETHREMKACGENLPQKVWRQMVYFDFGHRSALMSREYPQEKPGLAHLARKLSAILLAKADGVEIEEGDSPHWLIKAVNGAGCMVRGDEGDDDEYNSYRVGTSYSYNKCGQWHYTDAPTCRVRLQNGTAPRIDVGVEEIVCPLCGAERDDCIGGSCTSLFCPDCFASGTPCYECGHPISDGDIYWVDGDAYCYECFHDNYYYCSRCNAIVFNDDENTGADGGLYCDSCYSDLFDECCECYSTIYLDDAQRDTYDNVYCPRCFEEHTCECSECGEVYPNNETQHEVLDGKEGTVNVCRNCFTGADVVRHCSSCNEYFLVDAMYDVELCTNCHEILVEEEAEAECIA